MQTAGGGCILTHFNNEELYSSDVKMVIGITKTPVTTKQFILLFPTACFGLNGYHKVEHSNKRISINSLYVTEISRPQNFYHYMSINNMEE